MATTLLTGDNLTMATLLGLPETATLTQLSSAKNKIGLSGAANLTQVQNTLVAKGLLAPVAPTLNYTTVTSYNPTTGAQTQRQFQTTDPYSQGYVSPEDLAYYQQQANQSLNTYQQNQVQAQVQAQALAQQQQQAQLLAQQQAAEAAARQQQEAAVLQQQQQAQAAYEAQLAASAKAQADALAQQQAQNQALAQQQQADALARQQQEAAVLEQQRQAQTAYEAQLAASAEQQKTALAASQAENKKMAATQLADELNRNPAAGTSLGIPGYVKSPIAGGEGAVGPKAVANFDNNSAVTKTSQPTYDAMTGITWYPTASGWQQSSDQTAAGYKPADQIQMQMPTAELGTLTRNADVSSWQDQSKPVVGPNGQIYYPQFAVPGSGKANTWSSAPDAAQKYQQFEQGTASTFVGKDVQKVDPLTKQTVQTYNPYASVQVASEFGDKAATYMSPQVYQSHVNEFVRQQQIAAQNANKGGWLDKAFPYILGGAMLLMGIADPELLSLADAGELASEDLISAGIDPEVFADNISNLTDSGFDLTTTSSEVSANPDIVNTYSSSVTPIETGPIQPGTISAPEPVAPTEVTTTPTGPINPVEANNVVPVSEGPQLPVQPNAPYDITSTGISDMPEGTIVNNGQDVVMASGKTVPLDEYTNAINSQQPISVDGQMTTGVTVELNPNTVEPVAPGTTELPSSGNALPPNETIVDTVKNVDGTITETMADGSTVTSNADTGAIVSQTPSTTGGLTPAQIATGAVVAGGAVAAGAGAGGGGAAAPAVPSPSAPAPVTPAPAPVSPPATVTPMTPEPAPVQPTTPTAPGPTPVEPSVPGTTTTPTTTPGGTTTTPVNPNAPTVPGTTTPGGTVTPGGTTPVPGSGTVTIPGTGATSVGLNPALPNTPTIPGTPPGTVPATTTPIPPTAPTTTTVQTPNGEVNVHDYSTPYNGEYSNQSVLERFMSGTLTYGNILGLIAAGMVAPTVLSMLGVTPGAPSAPGMPGYGPLPPLNWGSATPLAQGGLNPGYLTFGGKPPAYYQTTNPVQSQYYWGQHPYMTSAEDLANYNKIPGAPATPFGVQQPREPFDVNKFIRETIATPQYQQTAMGASTQYPGGYAPATSYAGGTVAPAPNQPAGPTITAPNPSGTYTQQNLAGYLPPAVPGPTSTQVNMPFMPTTVPAIGNLPSWQFNGTEPVAAVAPYQLTTPTGPVVVTSVPV